jgi:hypothetical protein
MKARTFVVVGLAMLLCAPAVSAKKVNLSEKPEQQLEIPTRANGLLGSFSVSGGQTGPLEVSVDVSATTAGGNNTALNWVRLIGQVYNGYYSTYTWSDISVVLFPNAGGQGSFAISPTFTVPTPGDYLIWGRADGGIYSGITTGGIYSCPSGYICLTQSPQTCCYPATSGDFFYVDSTQPPTPTFNPDAGGIPIPTLGALGTISMVLLLAGVALLVIVRRH